MFANRLSVLAVVSLSFAVVAGCRNDSKPKHRTRSAKGTITRIDLPSNSVSMKIQMPKTGTEAEVTGTFTADTEIWINGVRKGPTDVEVNDEIRVEFQREGDDLATRFVVTKAEVTRAEDWKSTTPVTDGSKSVMQGATRRDLIKADQRAEQNEGGAAAPIDSRLSVPPTSTNPEDRAVKEQQVTDLIYGEIKRRYDESVAQRAEMLKAGKPANDPELQEKERIIRKARDLMMERGMNFDPVDPPLPEEQATTAPASS